MKLRNKKRIEVIIRRKNKAIERTTAVVPSGDETLENGIDPNQIPFPFEDDHDEKALFEKEKQKPIWEYEESRIREAIQ